MLRACSTTQVMQLQVLQRLMGRRPLLQALRNMPSILNHDPEGLALNYTSLSPVFGAAKLNDMLVKCVVGRAVVAQAFHC